MKYNYAPSLTDLNASLKYRTREYFLEHTLHGVPYFVDSSRPKWERILWFILTLLSIAAIFVIIVIIVGKFQTDPTITGLDIETKNIDIEFPQLFLCFDWPQLNHSRLQKNEMFIYEQAYNWNWWKDIDFGPFDAAYRDGNNFRSSFKTMVPDCDNLITDCAYKGVKTPCNQLFEKVLVSVGACCNFKTKEPLRQMDTSWNFEFVTSNSIFPWRLYFAENVDSTPKRNERPVTVAEHPVDIQFIVDVTYNTPDIRYLTLHQRGCHYKHGGASLNDCEINCFTDKIYSRCGCVPWFLSLGGKPECPLWKYSCLNGINIDMSKCNCWLSCDHTSHSVREIKKSTGNVNRIILRNWPTALYKREMRFGYFDLLVSYGGIASLFIGYSFLVSIEFGYYFSLRTYCGAVIKASRKKFNIKTVRVTEKVQPKTNVIPRYYQYVN